MTRSGWHLASLLLFVAVVTVADGASSGECYKGTAWQALQAQPNTTLWRASIQSTGIFQLLNNASSTENFTLYVPVDSSLVACSCSYTQSIFSSFDTACEYNYDLACIRQEIDWRYRLTDESGVGLLMLHMNAFGQAANTTPDRIPTLLGLATNASGGKWDLRVENGANGLATVTLADPSQKLNATLLNRNSSNIIKTITTCSGSTINIIDNPIIPADLPRADVNWIPGLEDYCWHNALSIIKDQANSVDFIPEAMGTFSPGLLSTLMDPTLNMTWLLTEKTALRKAMDGFLAISAQFPNSFRELYNTQIFLHMYPGGYCPSYLDGKTLNSFLGVTQNSDYKVNFTATPGSDTNFTIRNVHTGIPSQATFLGTACYTTLYRVATPIAEFISQQALETAPKSSVSATTSLPRVTEGQMRGVLQTCDNATSVQQDPEYKARYDAASGSSTSSDSSDSGLSTGAIVGITVGAVAAAALLAGAVVYRKKRTKSIAVAKDYSDNYDDFLKRVFEGKANFDWDTPPDVSGGPSSSDGGKTGTTDDTTTSLPPVPWSDFLLQAKDIEFSKDETTGERIVLGSGRYGTVYQGKLAGAETVAIKCINTAKVPGGSAISKEVVMKEIALLKGCRSQHIVSFQGVCFQNDEVQLVTELCEGGNLFDAIHEGKLNWYNGGYEIACDIVAGLIYLHSRRVVHLDIKSSNILLSVKEVSGEGKRKYTAKIGDVGLSKIIPISNEYLLSSSGHGGTWNWCAPEVILGVKCTTASDIFSAGVILWELATRELPVRGHMRDIRTPEDCPESVANLIQSCFRPQPQSRPTAAELMKILTSNEMKASSAKDPNSKK